MMPDQLLAHKKFSHIYIEKQAQEYPDTEAVIARFPKAQIVSIDNYKEVLNRSKQNWRLQKEAQSIILAKRLDEFLYEGTDIAPNFSHPHFYYNALTLNCIYNCHYCYLQGMYPSAHTVLFINNDDYFRATQKKLEELGSMYLCISYDTDLLAFEEILPQSKRWIEFAAKHEQLTIELRTKSINIRSLLDTPPVKNCVLAWTLSPEAFVTKYEEKTPPTAKRIQAMKKMAERGWRVRVCIDPVLTEKGWQEYYKELIDHIFAEIPAEKIADISLGTFRMPDRYFKISKKIRKDSELFYGRYISEHSVTQHSYDIQNEVKRELSQHLYQFYPQEQVVWI